MTLHIRPCLCFSVSTGTKVLAVLLAIGSCLLTLAGMVIVNKKDQVAAWLDGVEKVNGIPYDATGEEEVLLDPRSSFRVKVFGYEIILGGISGVVLALVIFLGARRADKHRQSPDENLPPQFNSISQ